jgi:hypothetical protein
MCRWGTSYKEILIHAANARLHYDSKRCGVRLKGGDSRSAPVLGSSKLRMFQRTGKLRRCHAAVPEDGHPPFWYEPSQITPTFKRTQRCEQTLMEDTTRSTNRLYQPDPAPVEQTLNSVSGLVMRRTYADTLVAGSPLPCTGAPGVLSPLRSA